MKPKVFLVDDEASLRHVLTRELTDAGFSVHAFATAAGVVESVRQECPEAILLDLRLPDADGLDLLKRIRASDDAAQVVVFTGHGSVPEAVAAMRNGAHDFLTKPVRLDVLEQVLRGAIEKRALIDANARLRRAIEPRVDRHGLLGDSAVTRRLKSDIERVAKSASHVLIQGENGTGKELVARAIHAHSIRAGAPLVVVNCGAIPSSIVESELFGHERGAFTGADRRRIGLFEAAHGGTLFLDEIGEFPKAVQPALLRALQFGEIRPVGSDRTREVDVRVVAATNRDLGERVRSGEFREDLYYRIAALILDVPPLRARREDIQALATAFLTRSATRSGTKHVLTPEALARLAEHDWPGNVRELENAIERLCVMSDKEGISVELVETQVVRWTGTHSELPSLDIEELEKLAIEAALRRFSGDKRAAASALGIALKTLYNKLDRYGLRQRAHAAADDTANEVP